MECLGLLEKRAIEYFKGKGIKPTEIQLDPLLPAFRLSSEEDFIKWFKFYQDLGVNSPDEMAIKNVGILRNHPLITMDVKISGYVYEVKTHRLRKPNRLVYAETPDFNTVL